MLGAVAAGIAGRHDGCVAAVTDGDGRVLASWAARGTGGSAAPPGSVWAEAQAGTNGAGTALAHPRAVCVRGPEHWSSALHDHSCVSTAVCDPVLGTAVAALTVSTRGRCLPVRPDDLLLATGPALRVLCDAAARSSAVLAGAFVDLGPARTAATARARRRRPGRRGERRGRRRGLLPRSDGGRALGRAVAPALVRAGGDDTWSGTVVVGAAGGAEPLAFRLRPVSGDAGPVGFLLAVADRTGAVTDDVLPVPPPAAGGVAPDRVAAVGRGGRLHLLACDDVRHARADGHDVWLVTDLGVLRAAHRGIDRLARELAPAGFLRVHRGHLVNTARVRTVHRGPDGMTVGTDRAGAERIPVSRRAVPAVRAALGL
ncbi:hypothetical protein L7F22_008607 [Adiantum nelumboides]|nr:hypothetical protein [Adiantum nelumboides]